MPRDRDTATEPKAFTYQARLIIDPTIDAALKAYAVLYGHAERCLFSAISRSADPDKIKPVFSRQHGITARQYNAISAGLTGKIASIKERRTSLIEESAGRIKKAREVVKKLSKKTIKPKVPKGLNVPAPDAAALTSYPHLQVKPLQANRPGGRASDVWSDVKF